MFEACVVFWAGNIQHTLCPVQLLRPRHFSILVISGAPNLGLRPQSSAKSGILGGSWDLVSKVISRF